MSKVTFNGPQKLIIIDNNVTFLNFREDVYSAWKEWVAESPSNMVFQPAMQAIGGDPLPGNRFLGTTFFLENGWKIRPWEGNHDLSIEGNVYSRDGSSLFVPTLSPYNVTVSLTTSAVVESISTSGGSGGITSSDISDITNSIWDHIIDTAKNQTARDKLKKIATKAQDIALKT